MAQLLTLKQFRANFHTFMRVMRDTGTYIDMAYGDDLVRLHVERLGKRPPRKYRPRAFIENKRIQAGECPTCSKLAINGVCVNPKCLAYEPPKRVDDDHQPQDGGGDDGV